MVGPAPRPRHRRRSSTTKENLRVSLCKVSVTERHPAGVREPQPSTDRTATVDSGFSWRSPSARLVLDAVLDILVDAGFEGLTREEVIARSGAAGRALGEFADLDALVGAALSRVRLMREPQPSGCLREDLRVLLRPWRGPRTRDEMIVAAVLSAAEHRPALREAVRDALDRPVAQAVGAVLSRDLPESVATQRVQTLSWLLRGLTLERLRTGARTPIDLERLIDFLIDGLGGCGQAAQGRPDR